MFCTKCGTQNEDEAKFCANCGNTLNNKNTNNDQNTENNRNNSRQEDTLDRFSNAIDNISSSVTNSFNNHKQIEVNESNFRYENSGIKMLTLSSDIDTSNVQQKDYANHYSQLGGFLAFIYYGGLISMALVCLGVIANILFSGAGLFKIISSQYWSYITPQLIINWILQLAFVATSFIMFFKFLMKIKHKDIDFLHFYHKICIIVSILVVVYSIAIILVSVLFNISYYFNPYYISSLGVLIGTHVGSIIGSLFSIALGALVLTLYFAKSIRVRTYMGTDMYLKLSYFTRNVISPQPATFQNESSQFNNTAQQQKSNSSNNMNVNRNANNEQTNVKSTESESVYCKNCGTEIIEGNVFCTNCGSRVA